LPASVDHGPRGLVVTGAESSSSPPACAAAGAPRRPTATTAVSRSNVEEESTLDTVPGPWFSFEPTD
jgi:hypothetical protein